MVVYLLYEHYYNGAECWDTVIDVYADETAAELAALELGEKVQSEDERSYFVKAMEMK